MDFGRTIKGGGYITKEEWNLLADWVYSGHSPYTNGDNVFDDDGWPLDFINTLRSWSEMQEYAESLNEDVSKNAPPEFVEEVFYSCSYFIMVFLITVQ